MKHLTLILFLAGAAHAQLFPGSASRIRSGSGSPAVGECAAASDTNRVYVDSAAIPNVLYLCRQTSSGVFSWDTIDTAGGSLDADLSAIAALSCTDGQYIVRSGGTWTCGAVAGSTAETYCVPSIVSGNLQISTPCQVLSGNVPLTFASSITFDGSSGTGVVQCGVANDGVFKCWHNVTATCTNATCVASTAVAPVDACLVATATVTSGTVSSPVNVLLGRNCFRATTSSTVSVTADPSTGVYTFDTVSPPSVYSCTDAVGTDSYACTASPAPGALSTGAAVYCFVAGTANTGAATFNLNSLGAKTIKKMSGAITTDLADNDIRVGQHVCLKYDGTNFQMLSQLGNAASGGSASASYTATSGSTTNCSTGTWVKTGAPISFSGVAAGQRYTFSTSIEAVSASGTYEIQPLITGTGIGADIDVTNTPGGALSCNTAEVCVGTVTVDILATGIVTVGSALRPAATTYTTHSRWSVTTLPSTINLDVAIRCATGSSYRTKSAFATKIVP